MQSENYEVPNEDLHAILHFVVFTLHFAWHPLWSRYCRTMISHLVTVSFQDIANRASNSDSDSTGTPSS